MSCITACICYVNVFGSMRIRCVQVDRREEDEKEHPSVISVFFAVYVCVQSTWVKMFLLL